MWKTNITLYLEQLLLQKVVQPVIQGTITNQKGDLGVRSLFSLNKWN